VVFLAAPKSCYKDCGKLVLRGARSGADLGNVDVCGGRTIHVAESAKYLGSLVHRDGSDRPDNVSARIKSNKGAFGCLRRCLFSWRDVAYEGKAQGVRVLGPRHLALQLGVLVSEREQGAGTTKLPPRLTVSAQCVAFRCGMLGGTAYQPRAAWSAVATYH
jgi:hypothetical protein